jgi:menaquinone-dependent protoporphyrinogen oxidase
MKVLVAYATRHGATKGIAERIASRPVWLFSSGPIGTDLVDAKGRDVFETARPAEFAELAESIHPRDEAIFFGAFDPDAKPIGLMERIGAPFMRMPAVRQAMPAGDFRDWPRIEAWAEGIALELEAVSRPAATHA